MANSIQKDQKRRNLYAKYEIKRLILKSMMRDLSLPKNLRFESINELSKLPRNSSLGRIKNRCTQTGRSKSNYKMFNHLKLNIFNISTQTMYNNLFINKRER